VSTALTESRREKIRRRKKYLVADLHFSSAFSKQVSNAKVALRAGNHQGCHPMLQHGKQQKAKGCGERENKSREVG
jgi:hypothetical protein